MSRLETKRRGAEESLANGHSGSLLRSRRVRRRLASGRLRGRLGWFVWLVVPRSGVEHVYRNQRNRDDDSQQRRQASSVLARCRFRVHP